MLAMVSTIYLPLSKSIANRLLVLQARAGVPLLPMEDDTPDDVRILHDALTLLTNNPTAEPCIDVNNCGTAMRFLTAYCALTDRPVLLTGCPRMQKRPIGQLVEALRTLGATIEYTGEEGFPPLRIHALRTPLPQAPRVQINRPKSTQFVSALLLMGVEVETDCTSPYIEMTRRCIERFRHGQPQPTDRYVERDWSSAAFWYEWVALHEGELFLEGLSEDTTQGDKALAELFRHMGVSTTFTPDGAFIRKDRTVQREPLDFDFTSCPDLYPAVAITCQRLALPLRPTGTDSLHIKESDRLQAVAEQKTYGDHRIAMALLAADLPCDDTECIKKSYPTFLNQLRALNAHAAPTPSISLIIPRRGVNDEGKGKKHALLRLISHATTDFVWLMDDDIIPPPQGIHGFRGCEADLLILPLRMQTVPSHSPNLLERLQMVEYDAIQGLTIWAARHAHPVLCSSANLIVRRDKWIESFPDLHPELASGDDMFLLESFKHRGLRIAVSEEEDLTAIVRPVSTWRAFFRQRMRWAGKAPAYRDRDIILCGATVLIANLLQILCPLTLLLKFPIEYALIRSREPQALPAKKKAQRFFIALLLEIVYPFYLLVSLLGGILCTARSHSTAF